MDPKELQLRKEIRKVIQKAMKESSDLTEGGLTGWVIDKVSNGLKWAVNKKADYQYDALLQSKDFRSLASKYKMSEKDWDKKARDMIRKDPKKFAGILAYDYSNSKLHKLGIW
jgi:hypothetical protein